LRAFGRRWPAPKTNNPIAGDSLDQTFPSARYHRGAALGVVACGPKEEPKKEAAKPAAPAAVTVKIAHAGPITGGQAHLGKDDEYGVALAVADLNAQKLTIDGKSVTFAMQSEDDQADPKIGATVAQKLVDAKVSAVIGHLNSGVSIPASNIYNQAGIR
jgi:branched-chain amino acid transport system substrate-binding protein